jgi:hypothetical protein
MKEAAGQKGMFRTVVDYIEGSRSGEWLLSFRGSPQLAVNGQEPIHFPHASSGGS